MSLGHAILGFLSRNPMTGYELKTRCFDQVAAHFWTADQAQIYRTLERLEEDGLTGSELEIQRGKPDRKVYSLTDDGRDALIRWLAQPKSLSPTRDPFLIQLFFSSELTEEDILLLLRSAREDHQGRLDQLRDEEERGGRHLHRTARQKRDSAVEDMTLTAAIAATNTTIDWLDDCIMRVEAGLPAGASTARGH